MSKRYSTEKKLLAEIVRPERLEIERRADAFISAHRKREGRIVMAVTCSGVLLLGWIILSIWGLL